MQIQIPKITINAFEAFGNPNQEVELDRQEKAVMDAWSSVYRGIVFGMYNVAFWDCHYCDHNNSFMRYALHKSTQRDGFLQLSVMEICDSEVIPTSHTEHGNFEHFFREVKCESGLIVTARENY